MSKLTVPQRRMLAEVRAAGERHYNGRAAKTITALVHAGLVEATWDFVRHERGQSLRGADYTQRWTVRPVQTPAERNRAAIERITAARVAEGTCRHCGGRVPCWSPYGDVSVGVRHGEEVNR